MNREQIIRMAREAVRLPEPQTPQEEAIEHALAPIFERFAALVAEHERNACAKVVEDYCGAWDDKGYTLAAAIRARSKQCG
jgi:hypothetical protein